MRDFTIGKSFLLCIKEWQKGELTEELKERTSAAYQEFYSVYFLCQGGHNMNSNLYGKKKLMDGLGGLFAPTFWQELAMMGRERDWDRVEADIEEIGCLLDFEMEYNTHCMHSERDYDKYRKEYLIAPWLKKNHLRNM